MSLKFRLYNAILAVDQLANCFIGSGFCDETLSAYSYRVGCWRKYFVDALLFWDTDHCYKSYMSEYLRKQMPKEYTYREFHNTKAKA